MTGHAVVIAGGGPTGLMLAGELALARVDVAIVERRESQDLAGSRAGGLHARTLEVLDQRGIADRFLAQGKAMQVLSPRVALPWIKAELSAEEIKDFQDFILWRLCELSAKYELPFQIHTGHARIQGSNPMLLVDVIEANPRTQFALFHGGFPWIGESAAIAARHRNVHLDTVWLPTLSQTMARRALHEWLDVLPADRIRWRIPFCHHPPFCAGPQHRNTDGMGALVALFEAAGVAEGTIWICAAGKSLP